MAEHDHLCFADFEFTCGGGVGRTGCEMLSVGIIVCDEKYNITDTYYSTARPAKIHKINSFRGKYFRKNPCVKRRIGL